MTMSTSSRQRVHPNEPLSHVAPPLVAQMISDVVENGQQRWWRMDTNGKWYSTLQSSGCSQSSKCSRLFSKEEDGGLGSGCLRGDGILLVTSVREWDSTSTGVDQDDKKSEQEVERNTSFVRWRQQRSWKDVLLCQHWSGLWVTTWKWQRETVVHDDSGVRRV